MSRVQIGRVGLIANSEHKNHRVRVVEDAENTGGFLIFEWWDGSTGPNENHAFDSWVETRADLEQLFGESNWSVDWNAA